MTLPAGTLGTNNRNAHLVRFDAVRLGPRRAPLLADLTLTIHPGHFWCFMIPPGPLRKALTRTFLGIARTRGGTVDWNRSFSAPSTPTARIGFVPETFSLPAGVSMTVREFVSLGLIGIAAGGASEAQRIAWALEQVGLPDSEGHDVATMSTGERSSLLVARALARRPRLLVADDPTADLGRETREALLEVVARLNRNERLTIAWLTTNVEVAQGYATHIAVPADRGLRTARRGHADFETTLEAVRDPARTGDFAPLRDDDIAFPSPASSDQDAVAVHGKVR